MSLRKSYDTNNIFAKILRGEIPCDKVYEDDHVLAFNDIHPKAPIHILIIPKGPYCSLDDFYEKASDVEIAALMRAVGLIARQHGIDATGYRFLANHGDHSGQEVPHFHIHLFGGKPLGPMLVNNP